MKLYLWPSVLYDSTPGVAFAIAESLEEAKELLINEEEKILSGETMEKMMDKMALMNMDECMRESRGFKSEGDIAFTRTEEIYKILYQFECHVCESMENERPIWCEWYDWMEFESTFLDQTKKFEKLFKSTDAEKKVEILKLLKELHRLKTKPCELPLYSKYGSFGGRLKVDLDRNMPFVLPLNKHFAYFQGGGS